MLIEDWGRQVECERSCSEVCGTGGRGGLLMTKMVLGHFEVCGEKMEVMFKVL